MFLGVVCLCKVSIIVSESSTKYLNGFFSASCAETTLFFDKNWHYPPQSRCEGIAETSIMHSTCSFMKGWAEGSSVDLRLEC